MAGDEEFVNDEDLISLFEYDGSNNPVYIGFAEPGSATSDPAWLIRKLTWSGSNVTAIQYANGSTVFNSIWDNRASLSYS